MHYSFQNVSTPVELIDESLVRQIYFTMETFFTTYLLKEVSLK